MRVFTGSGCVFATIADFSEHIIDHCKYPKDPENWQSLPPGVSTRMSLVSHSLFVLKVKLSHIKTKILPETVVKQTKVHCESKVEGEHCFNSL